MTLTVKKRRERFFAEEAAKALGKAWTLGPDCEHPDFLVTDGSEQFGLEVIEIFMGAEDEAGSSMKRKESRTQKTINDLRREYEQIVNVPLSVRFVGILTAEIMERVVPVLVTRDLASKPTGHRVVIDDGQGLRMHVTKALRPDWISVNDRAGWVDQSPVSRITDAIAKKSAILPRYKLTAGPDIRLLIVADQIHNSGKLRLTAPIKLEPCGFQAVYFYSYPEAIVVVAEAAKATSA